MILVVDAHPYPGRSRAGAVLREAIRDLPGLEMRSLYRLYPDFDIDTLAEQEALARAGLVVWMHPLFWYTVPGLMKHWFDEVLTGGWAHGQGGDALKGKDCLWVVSTGGDEAAFSADGRHGHPFDTFAPVVEQTARYCGMNWLSPFVVHGAHEVTDEVLQAAGRELRARLEAGAA